jgi:formaldehyde-activating enzyme involved in methanogenesis
MSRENQPLLCLVRPLVAHKPSTTLSKEQMKSMSMAKLISNLDVSCVQKNDAQREYLRSSGASEATRCPRQRTH